jgi:cytochrome oxidase Cu insertion factor (SCO1/SenC/PrrC family)
MGARKNLRSFKMMTWNRSWVEFACLASACLILFTTSITGQTPSAKPTGQQEKQKPSGRAIDDTTEKPDKFVIPDVIVTDQNGKKLNFYTDLVKNKKVIVNFVYTSCNGICPTTGGHFAKLQTALGKKVGTDIFMITITTDPETDTPERLKAWSKKYNPAPDWTLVTGSVENITRLLQVFTGDGVNTGYHVPAVCLVNDIKKSQNWTYGLAPIEDLLKMVDGM